MKKDGYEMRLDVKPNVIKNPNAPKYKIRTLNDLYQVATTKNINRLMGDLKKTFMLSLLMENAVHAVAKGKNPDYKPKKLTVTNWDWCDDTVNPPKNQTEMRL